MASYHVTLNSQGYVLDLDRYRKRVREPFAAKQATSSASFAAGDLRGPEQLLVISDWSGGEGYAQHDEAHAERWRSGTGVDGYSISGGLQLGPYTAGPFAAALEFFRPLAVYKGKVYIGGPGVAVYSWDGTTFANPFNLPSAEATCAAVFSDVLYLGNATDGKLSSWDGTTLTGTVATAGGPIHMLATHYRQAAQYLYVGADSAGANGIGRIYYYDGATLSAGQIDTEEFRPVAAVVSSERLYIVAGDSVDRRWGLYSVDDSGSGGVWTCHARVEGGYGVSAAALNGVVYVGDGYGGRIWAWDGTRLSVAKQLSSGGAAYTSELRGMAVFRGALWVTVVTSVGLDLLRFDGTAWSRPVGGTAFGVAGVTAERMVAFAEKLVAGSRKATTSGVAQPFDPTTFGSTGTLDSGLISCGLPGVSKLFRSVTIVTSAIVSPQTVKVEYQLEDTGSWTTLGTLSSVGATTATYSFSASTTGRQIAFRVTLTGTAGASASPVLYQLALRYTPWPTVTREWELGILLEGTAELPMVTLDGSSESSTGVTLTAALWTAAAAAGPVSYVDLDGVTYSVYVEDVREEIANISQRKGIQRLGVVRLVEAA